MQDESPDLLINDGTPSIHASSKHNHDCTYTGELIGVRGMLKSRFTITTEGTTSVNTLRGTCGAVVLACLTFINIYNEYEDGIVDVPLLVTRLKKYVANPSVRIAHSDMWTAR